MPYPLDYGSKPWAFKAKINIYLSSSFPGPSHLFKMAAAFQSKLKVFTGRFCYVSHGNAPVTCYEETFRELEAVKLSPSANRKPLRYENKPRAGASSIVACPVLTEFRRMFYNRVQWGQKKREPKKQRELIGKHCKKSLQHETPPD